ncbi:MFS transporter [Galbitalea sp. SE-J8]|uniref:MFS transporter n=1 Tax=Galbitalea sp. SE-J8 TaxID=3054952 RepID=UPI00259CD06B|nr:MFS transporter [Galbitalea sp. SE-J8]MDM4764164.1 MFS transporter [Galbitalea sp. SE-J8]
MTAIPESTARVTFRLVGFLFALELVSGILQGYYVPLISDIARHLGITDAQYNWFEAIQLLVSALVVPVLAKLGDMYGHKRMLLIATVVTALASWGLVLAGGFWSYLAAFAFQGFYTVWLPLEVALIFDAGRRSGAAASQTRRAAGFLVVALELGAILGALGGSAVFGLLGDAVAPTLVVPAVAVTLVFFAILFGVPESQPLPGRTLDGLGFVLLALALAGVTTGLTLLHANGPGSLWPWLVIAAGLVLLAPFARYELRQADPAIDLRMLRRPEMWPVQVTAGLFGIAVLGAQTPLSTYAGTNPAEVGYGLGLSSGGRSIVIGVYLISMIVGALLFPVLSRRSSPRIALIVAAFFVAAGYLAFIPLHATTLEVVINMVVAGIGSGALVAALPAAAAAAAPRGRTGIAAGMTNTTKTIGGSFASSVFGIVLATGAVGVAGTAASFSGYLTTWVICGVGALAAAVLLFFVPKLAFADAETPREDVLRV